MLLSYSKKSKMSDVIDMVGKCTCIYPLSVFWLDICCIVNNIHTLWNQGLKRLMWSIWKVSPLAIHYGKFEMVAIPTWVYLLLKFWPDICRIVKGIHALKERPKTLDVMDADGVFPWLHLSLTFWSEICRMISLSIYCGNLNTCWIRTFLCQQTWSVL